ncbi:o-succinylbenzoate synthase [Thiohalomonas denitrificans]|uniref:o-succinylbenzoate synthase n=1 Tax=Thiohalomonas denitrificans TaxID=415747 RepID=UPI0026F2E1BE|nr:o-succinylbenzoate synthase [Thiohalomonas denitrificans]
MVIEQARLQPYRLPFRVPWLSARSHLSVRHGWLVLLTARDGRVGRGDCAPLAAAGTETDAASTAWLRRQLPRLRGISTSEGLAALEATAPPAARFAVETALLDLEAQAREVPLWRLLTGSPAPSLACNAAVGPIDERIGTRLAEAAEEGFRIAKLKVGIGPPEVEAARLREVCRDLPAKLGLRLDANAAWSETEAGAFLAALDGLPVEMVEEPLAQPYGDALARLQASAPCALALDENLVRVGIDIMEEQKPVARAVLKPAVCGGIVKAAAIAKRLRTSGIGCVVTTTLEGPVGTWAALHLAVASGSPELAHGLATAIWFDADPASFPKTGSGIVNLPEGPGLGPQAPGSPWA